MLETVRLVIYRIKEKGLEIFLVNTGDQWEFPEISESRAAQSDASKQIALDPVTCNRDRSAENGGASERVWPDIPSLPKALQNYRARLSQRGFTRFEITALETDRDLFRSLARRLAEEGPEAEQLRFTVQIAVAVEPPKPVGILAALRRSRR